MKLCKEDLLINIFKCMGSSSISTVIVKIWQIFIFYKVNWNPRPLSCKYLSFTEVFV